MESGPSLSVLGDLESFRPFCAIKFLLEFGLKKPLLSIAVLDSIAASGGAGLGFPEIMLSHRASTSTVAAVVSAKGFFFSSFLCPLH
jgi:hypothetical protein